ncbi:MAG: hypothetical protein ACXAC8_12315 [Candidatus Hodarchaeales archaeon]|jgi:glyoxylase-like metal-dependent hydrolase (beta-lactamase superfamily II)
MIEEQLEHIEVTENIIRTAIYPHEVDHLVRTYESQNMCCLVLPDELFFIDTLARNDLTTQFRRDMEKRFNRPTTHLFLSHDHWHCAFGMSVFNDVTVVISSSGKSYYRKNIKNGVYDNWKEWLIRNIPDDDKLHQSLINAKLFVPPVGVGKPRLFGPKEQQILFKPVGMHSRPSSIIYSKSEKTIFTGGTLNTCYGQFIWPLGVIDLYKEWEEWKIDHVIPGHGFSTDKSYITTLRIYFEELLTGLRKLKREGLSKSQVLKQTDKLPQYPFQNQKSWIENSDYHTRAVNNHIKWWYGQVLKEANEEDLMFIS